MAGELDDRAKRRLHRHFSGPWSGPGLGIFGREAVEKRVLRNAGEAFDDAQVPAGAAEGRLAGEVRRLDNERIPLPTAARISHPLPDAVGRMRAPVEGNEPDVVDHLDQNGHVTRPLHDLVGVVVASGKDRRPGVHHDAAVVELVVLRRVPPAAHPPVRLGALVRVPLPLRCQRRDSPVRGIDDQRRAQGLDHRGLIAGQTELAEVVVDVGHAAGLGCARRVAGRKPPPQRCVRIRRRSAAWRSIRSQIDVLLLRIELLRNVPRPLHGRVGGVRPVPLQVRLPVRRARRGPRCSALRSGCGRGILLSRADRWHHERNTDSERQRNRVETLHWKPAFPCR